MKTNNMISEEIVLSKEELSNVSGGHSVKCIGCGNVIKDNSALGFALKVKIHNSFCSLYKKAKKLGRPLW